MASLPDSENLTQIVEHLHRPKQCEMNLLITIYTLLLLFIINVKTFQFKTQCKGIKSHIQNCTDHFGEDA